MVADVFQQLVPPQILVPLGCSLSFFFFRVAFSKSPIGLSDPRISFSLTLMPLGFIAWSCCCVVATEI